MNKKLIIISLFFAVIFAISCENKIEKSDKIKSNEEVKMITTSTNDRVNLDVSYVELKEYSTLRTRRKDGYTSNFNYELIRRASVKPPKFEGKLLRASHIKIKGDFAFVTYNYEASEFAGGIDVFNISEIKEPVLVASALISLTDISAVDVYGNRVYLAGGVNIDKTSADDDNTPSILKILEFNGTSLTEYKELRLEGHVATSVVVDENAIFVTTGDNGYFFKFKKTDISLEVKKSFSDLRSLAINENNKLFVLKGSPATLMSYNAQSEWKTSVVDGANTLESKTYMKVVGNRAFIPLNEQGLKIFNIETGMVQQSFDRPQTPEGGVDSDYVTNGVDILEDFLFIANGGAGISLNQRSIIGDENSNYIVRAIANLDASANFIESKKISDKSIVMFVATGTKGLEILELVKKTDYQNILPEIDDLGAPTKKEAGTVNDTIITDFNKFIKDKIVPKEDVYTNIINKMPTHIELTKDAEVWVTYVSEEAGYKNTLAYYSFDLNNPPTKISEVKNKNIIFPNCSGKGSGGNMMKGDRVSLGKFPGGTGIGFILLSNAWNSRTHSVGTPYWTLYSNPQFNPRHYNQNLFLYEPKTNTTILSYEDILISGGDRDYDDVIFLINTDTDAINTSKLIDMGQYID